MPAGRAALASPLASADRRPGPCALAAMLWLALMLAACQRAPADAAAAARQASDDAHATAACQGNPLVRAMPPRQPVAGLPFRRWDCTFNSIHALYGQDDGREVSIDLIDTRSPAIDQQPAMQDFYRRSFDGQRAFAQSSLHTLQATIDGFKDHPGSAQAADAPAYVPIAEPSAGGAPYYIHVGTPNDPAPAEVLALFNDRHVLTLQATDEGAAIDTLTAAQAQALYQPFLAQLHPERLP